MKQEEFITQNSKVSEYSRLQDKESKLVQERGLIELGVIEIVTAYQKRAAFYGDRSLEKKVVEAICKVYDDEINNIIKLKEGL